MSRLISGSTSIDEARAAKDAKRMERKNAGFDSANAFITIKQHEMLMSASLQAYDESKNAEILEYVEYRLSVRGRVTAYRRLWAVRAGLVARPFVEMLNRYREIQKRKRLRAMKNDPAALTPQEVVERIENA